jgi:RNA polymerase sigma-70 factor (ECF subfamily)
MDDRTRRREEPEARWRRWMVLAQSGDGVAYEKLLQELLPSLRRFVRRRLGDPSAGEDVVQNVLLAIHRARHTYRPERPFAPWLYAVARNAVTDHLRARGRRLGRELSLEPGHTPEPAAPAASDAGGLSAELEAALAALPPAQREAVVLVQLEGLSVAEAAARAGISRTALKVRAHRGYRALRAKLEPPDA